MMWMARLDSPLGELILASEGTRLTGLWFKGQKYEGDVLRKASEAGNPPMVDDWSGTGPEIFLQTKEWLERYFAGKKPSIEELPLDLDGSAFQQQVWKLLCEIPYGKVTTYGALAREMAALWGRKSPSPQAVGQAVGHNPISIIVPCHRVVGSDGSLTGYAGGIDRKRRLLLLEGVDPESL